MKYAFIRTKTYFISWKYLISSNGNSNTSAHVHVAMSKINFGSFWIVRSPQYDTIDCNHYATVYNSIDEITK